ncbi:MAG TPA: class I SAM-dependent methyltransferase [Gaiellaceae bacterium]|nr:class I SAM-dependent methyltransferase [Gaiellaceae bacterium]
MDELFGETCFSGIELSTAPGRVMTPRPASEQLLERAVARLGSRSATVADVGSGSGALAVAVALRAPNVEVWAADLSPAAVELARANVARHGLEDRVRVLRGDLLEAVPGEVDVVLANLPYLPQAVSNESRYADLHAEPASAVFSPGDGLGPYRRLLEACEERLRAGGLVIVQYRGDVFEGSRRRLSELLGELEEHALAA